MPDFILPKYSVFLKYYSSWAISTLTSRQSEKFIFMLIEYDTIFKMPLEASNAEPLAPAPHL